MSTENTVKKPNHDSTKPTENRIRSSTKRPRAPIACFRCHHKKVNNKTQSFFFLSHR